MRHSNTRIPEGSGHLRARSAPAPPLPLDRRAIGRLLPQELLDVLAVEGRRVSDVVVELEEDAPGVTLEGPTPRHDPGQLLPVVEVAVLLGHARLLAAELLHEALPVSPV